MAKVIERLEKRVITLEESISDMKKHIDVTITKENKEKLSKDISLIREEITEQLDELKKDVDKNAEDIKKLEELSKRVDGFSAELDSLKDEVLAEDAKADKEDTPGSPSLFASVVYGGLIANTLGNLPVVGKSIKAWAEKKVADSSKEEAESGNKKPGFFKKLWNTVFWSGIATAGIWLGRKLIPEDTMKEIKSWFPWTDEAKKKKEESQQNQEPKPSSPEPSLPSDQEESSEEIVPSTETVPSTSDASDETVSEESSESSSESNDIIDEQEANQEVERMYTEGYSELYILMKMYQLGFVPEGLSGNSKFRVVKILKGQPLEWAGKFSREMKARLMQSFGKNRDIATQLKLDAIANSNPELVKNFDAKSLRLTAIIDDLEKGKITSLDDLNKKYPELVKEFGEKNFVQTQKQYLNKLKLKSQLEFDRMQVVESEVKQSDIDLKKLKNDAQIKLKELDAQAKTADAATKKKLQGDAQKIIDDYNRKVLAIEKNVAIKMTCLDANEVQRLSKIGVVDGLLKFNGKIDGFLKGKASGRLLLGAGLFTLATNYATGKMDIKQFGLEVADISIGMIPFGGAYDIYTSITGEGIAGELSTNDRWLRGALGGITLMLDVAGFFTFGVGTAASASIKGVVKGGSLVAKGGTMAIKASKVGKAVLKGAEGTMMGVKILGLGYLGYSLVTSTVPVLYDLGKMGIEKIEKKLTPDIKVE